MIDLNIPEDWEQLQQIFNLSEEDIKVLKDWNQELKEAQLEREPTIYEQTDKAYYDYESERSYMTSPCQIVPVFKD